MMRRLGLAGVLMLVATGPALATACPQHYVDATPPHIGNVKMLQQTQELCYRTFSDLDSGIIREPLYAAEHLTAASVARAKGMSRREERFHPDPNLAPEMRAELSDYRGSGYDRGHMANWADTADPDSFSLGNMVPQNPDNNRNLWEGIETSVRGVATEEGEVWVISGPIFQGRQISVINNRVAVPNMLFKAVYSPALGAAVYLTRNADGQNWQFISVDQLIALNGIDPFPSLSEAVKAVVGRFPEPDEHGHSIPANGDLLSGTPVPPSPGGIPVVAGRSESGSENRREGVSEGTRIAEHVGIALLIHQMLYHHHRHAW